MKNFHTLLLAVLLLSSCFQDDERFVGNAFLEERDEMVELINSVVTPIFSSNPIVNFSELEVLDQLSETRIIGMGEASHGTKEFFEMKHKMLRYFVEQHGYRGIIMEADFGECLKANQYILHNIGTIEDVLEDMHFWTWRTEEVKEMMQWMNSYNLDKHLKDKIYYLGSDCQFTDTNIEEIENRISMLPEVIENSLRMYTDSLSKDIIELRGTGLREIENNIAYVDSLILGIQFYQTEIESAISNNEYEILLRLCTVCKQVYDSARNNYQNKPYNLRDLYMAENTIWWADHFGQDEKFLVWAHNYHVSTVELNETYGGSQGTHLRAILGQNYKVIGFSMAMGAINAFNNQGLVAASLPLNLQFSSLNEIFYLSEKNNFIWVLSDEIKNNPDFKWFDDNREFLIAGAAHPTAGNFYTSVNIFKEYDTMIHFDFSTPSGLIH